MDVFDIDVMLSHEMLMTIEAAEVPLECDIFEKSKSQIAGFMLLKQNKTPVEQFNQATTSFSKLPPIIGVKQISPAKRASLSKGPMQKAKAIKGSAPALPNQVVTTSGGGGKVDVSSMMSVTQNLATNEKSYKCSFCGFESSHVSSVTRHIETKHLPSTVMFNCRSCQYSSKFKHNLKSHYMKAHNMPAPAAEGMLTCM